MLAELPSSRKERLLVCIANNHPGSRDKTHMVVDEVKARFAYLPWEWHFLDRKETLPPIDSWYSAIRDVAEKDEVILLQGDDDLFTPWSVTVRYSECSQSGADLLLSRSLHGLIYLSSHEVYFPQQFPPHTEGSHSRVLDWGEINGWGPAFIGNHCYRNTSAFQAGIERAFTWCEGQDWLDHNTRTLMLPYYLPYAVKLMGGNLRCLDSHCVIRGRSLEEIVVSPYGVPGWNSGFLAICAYGVLSGRDLKEIRALDSARSEQAKMGAEWFFTFFVDKRIPNEVVKNTLQRIRLPISAQFRFLQLMSIRRVVVDKLGFTAWRLRRRAVRASILTSDLLYSLMRRDPVETRS
ncbi:MAG: hypothetical protein K1X65_10990 [Caldilineales bacterium]|nr:hypothetical protein [Caldilineales bacterium]